MTERVESDGKVTDRRRSDGRPPIVCLLLLTAVLTGGCLAPSSGETAPDSAAPDTPELVRRAERHLLEVRTEEWRRALSREHLGQERYLGIPGRLAAWRERGAAADARDDAESRETLETAVMLLQQLLLSDDTAAAAILRERARQRLELEVRGAAARLDSLRRQQDLLTAARRRPGFTAGLLRELEETEDALAETLLELRVLTGAAPEGEPPPPPETRDLPLPPPEQDRVVALSGRPESGGRVPPEALERLEALLPPEKTGSPAETGMRRAELLFRLPVRLAQRKLAEQPTPPECVELAAALGIAAELAIDRRRLAAAAAARKRAAEARAVAPDDPEGALREERAALEYTLAALTLAADLGFAGAPAAPPATAETAARYRAAAELLARMAAQP